MVLDFACTRPFLDEFPNELLYHWFFYCALSQASVSVKRLSSYLKGEELDPEAVIKEPEPARGLSGWAWHSQAGN